MRGREGGRYLKMLLEMGGGDREMLKEGRKEEGGRKEERKEER